MRASGDKKATTAMTTYYYCNRSGFFHSRGKGHRQLKCQGSSKISSHCTAAIRVSTNLFDDSVNAEVHHTHYGHSQVLGHVRLPEADRLKIAGQLAQGIGFERVLDEIRDNVGTEFSRTHLVTRKDLANIEKAFGLRGIEKHLIDSVSVSIWVESMKLNKNKPVLLYKPQGQAHPSCRNLKDEDFVIVIQTPLQRQMMTNMAPY